ncbi:cupin domain-containing protein [Natrarchaeobius sp. A-rgal3]|uniref:cupin domain-containing protein n=1 Tax=Natrarchaeobius versutus TaxID=1679078 RepID=UPI00350F061E
MPATDFDAERVYDDDRFSVQEIFRNDRVKVACGYFEPGQFIPVHAPESDLVINVQQGTGVVRDDEVDRDVARGDVVVVEAGVDRGIEADDDVEAGVDRVIEADDDRRLEALLVVSPPPTDAEHEPVRRGLATDEFDPEER